MEKRHALQTGGGGVLKELYAVPATEWIIGLSRDYGAHTQQLPVSWKYMLSISCKGGASDMVFFLNNYNPYPRLDNLYAAGENAKDGQRKSLLLSDEWEPGGATAWILPTFGQGCTVRYGWPGLHDWHPDEFAPNCKHYKEKLSWFNQRVAPSNVTADEYHTW